MQVPVFLIRQVLVNDSDGRKTVPSTTVISPTNSARLHWRSKVGVGVNVAVGVIEGVSVAVGVKVSVGVCEGVAEAVGVGVRVAGDIHRGR